MKIWKLLTIRSCFDGFDHQMTALWKKTCNEKLSSVLGNFCHFLEKLPYMPLALWSKPISQNWILGYHLKALATLCCLKKIMAPHGIGHFASDTSMSLQLVLSWTYPIALGSCVKLFDWSTSFWSSRNLPISFGILSSLFSSRSNTRSLSSCPMPGGSLRNALFDRMRT